MKIETQTLEDHQIKLIVEPGAEALESAKQRAARRLSKRAKIPGFRPGKAPYPVIVRHFGEGAILEEALELLVDEVYPRAIEEAGISPYGPGSLENVESLDPPKLEFVVPLEAEVDLGDYRSIRHDYELPEITDEDVEEVVLNLLERQAVIEPIERPAEEGDIVYATLSAKRLDIAEAEEETLIEEQAFPVLIKPEGDKDEADEWPFPGFSRQLIGLSAGNEIDLTHKFEEDADFESLRGVTGEFHVKVDEIKSRKLPEANDEFAASVGEYESMEALREDIRAGLEEQAQANYEKTYNEDVLRKAVESATIKFPPQMLEHEVDSVIHNLEHRLENQNLDLDLYLKTREMDMDALREELKPTAETRLKNALVLYELAREQDIQIEAEELETETRRTMDSLTQNLPEDELRKLNSREVYANLINNIAADMLSEKALSALRQIAKGEEPEARPEESAEELPPEAKEAEAQPEAESGKEQPEMKEDEETQAVPEAQDSEPEESVEESLSVESAGEEEASSEEEEETV